MCLLKVFGLGVTNSEDDKQLIEQVAVILIMESGRVITKGVFIMAVANAKEKRQAHRIELLYYIRVFDQDGDRFLGHLVDLSEKGVMITSDEPFEPNKTYNLKMDTSIDLNMSDDISFTAKNVWCDGNEAEHIWDGGFQLLGMSDEATEVFHAYLNGELV